MNIQMFSVRDAKAQTFGNPFFFPTVGVALRSLTSEVNKGGPDSIVSAHPEDFELFHLGEFDPSTAILTLFPAPKPVVIASSLKNGG